MTKTEELLAVLDLPKDEQQEWWQTHYGEKWGCANCLELAAFRLRDEQAKDIPETPFYVAMLDVQNYIQKDSMRAMDYRFWAFAQPIRWVIAALIAKENI